jgi:hypothetical protein
MYVSVHINMQMMVHIYIQAGKQMSRRERQRAMARSFNGTGGAIRTLARQQASHLQGLLDGVELFCGCTGHEMKTNKSHVLILMWLVDTTGGAVEWPTALASALVMRRWLPSNTRWEPVLGPEEAFPLAMPSAEKRHLRHFQDAYGNSIKALNPFASTNFGGGYLVVVGVCVGV